MNASRTRSTALRALPLALALLPSLTVPAAAQKDYFNLDKNRPVRIEDAYATERFALEVKLAPLRLERERGGVHRWGIDPEIAYGILPRTSVEVGFPFAIVDGGDERHGSGLTGIELSIFHNLNMETRSLPALALRADVVLPVGALSSDGIHPAVTAIATRSLGGMRFHGNARYAFGDAAGPGEEVGHGASRWLAGVAVDRAFPLDAYLVIADLYAEQPLHADDPIAWNAGAGIRYQLNPSLALDAGIGRRLTADPTWYVTFGSAWHVGVRALMPGVR